MALSGAALEETVVRLDEGVSKILTILTTALPRSLEGQLYVTQAMIEAGVDRELKALELRHKIFPKIAHGQISWTLLLVAYKHTTQRKPLSVTNLMSWSLVPPTTSLRHLNLLEDEGLLDGEADVNDARRRWITATAETRRLMVRYFTEFYTS